MKQYVDVTLVDELGSLQAQIASLQERERELKEQVKRELLKANQREAEGVLYRVSYSVAERVSVDSKSVSVIFPRSEYPELYRSALVETLRVAARNAQILAA